MVSLAWRERRRGVRLFFRRTNRAQGDDNATQLQASWEERGAIRARAGCASPLSSAICTGVRVCPKVPAGTGARQTVSLCVVRPCTAARRGGRRGEAACL